MTDHNESDATPPNDPSVASCFGCPTILQAEWCVILPEEVRTLNAAKRCHAYTSGETIFYQGNPCLGIFCVLSGTIALRRTDPSGRTTIVRMAHSGMTLGYRAYFADSPYSASAEAMTDCKVCFIGRDAVRSLLERSVPLGHRFLSRLAGDLEQSEKLRLQTALSVRERLAHLLLVLKDRHGQVDDDGTITIELPLARTDIASTIDARPESVSRAIRDLESGGVVRFEGRRVSIGDLDVLLDEIEPQ